MLAQAVSVAGVLFKGPGFRSGENGISREKGPFTMRKMILTVMGALLVASSWTTQASAELNLWVSFHFGGTSAYYDGEYQSARTLLNKALDETQTRYRRGDTYERLGAVYAALGQFQDAESAFHEALRLKESDLGSRHRELASILNNLADLKYLLNKHNETESLYRRALDINRRDQWNLEVARSLNGLALVHNDAGEYVEAENHLLRAVEVHEKGMRRNSPFLATAVTNLGILYTNLGRYDEAEPQFIRARYIQDQELRPDHPDVAVRLHATAALYQSTGRLNEAIVMANEAEAIRDKQAANQNLY